MSRPILTYAGPSITAKEILGISSVFHVKNPIRRGDLLNDYDESYAAVVIIDGVFHQDFPVSPSEIRELLGQGVTVYGASSMGALRAAELHPLGMVGVGQIFEWYRDGEILDESEVALIFTTDTFRPLSVPMVNIRYSVRKTLDGGLLTQEEAQALVESAKNRPYRERTYQTILSDVSVGSDRRAPLLEELMRYDLKKTDAISCLQACLQYVTDRTTG